MAMEPALDFWLRYVERSGGLVEPGCDTALAVLSPALAQTLGCPEETVVTACPDAARDDGAELLIPGHPALDRAATATLDRGDAGNAWLRWPSSPGPPHRALQQRARERFPVAHGRLDLGGPLATCYAPLVRLGALATYTLSLEERFQERVEVWVDGSAGQPLEDRASAALRVSPLSPAPDTSHPRHEADLAAAVARTHDAAEAQARARRDRLAAMAEEERQAERARAEDYFAAALQVLARRQETADAERRELLEAQADATRAERTRRLREIDEAFRPRHELRPYRLHLVWAPALRVPAEIRRGAATHRLTLTWLLAPVAAFVPPACPACGAGSPLVAGRAELGCRSCQPGGGPR
ncbi:MAG: hypothetical protein WD080_11970 [Egibacteraceae bacterium]